MNFDLYKYKNKVIMLVTLGIIFPFFFQLSGDIYNAYPNPLDDSNGSMMIVPLPISLLSCFVGLIYFVRNFSIIKLSLSVIVATTIFLLISVLVVGASYSKYLLIIQYIVPLFALVLGIVLGGKEKQIVPKTILFFLVFFIPSQVIATWLQGQLALTHYLYGFSVYQHYQYVPLVMTALFTWIWVELRNTHIKYIYCLAPWIAIYCAAGNSVLALFGLVVFSLSFAFFARGRKIDFIIPMIILMFITAYFYANSQLAPIIQKQNKEMGIAERAIFGGKFFDNNGNFLYSDKFKAPINVVMRADLAKLYLHGIFDSRMAFLFGNSDPISRKVTSSAHNYYLDMSYSFGVLACFPILMLLIYSSVRVLKNHSQGDCLIWLFLIVLYLAVVDSFFKVTLRQPYPGLITFFMWGAVLRRLQILDADSKL